MAEVTYIYARASIDSCECKEGNTLGSGAQSNDCKLVDVKLEWSWSGGEYSPGASGSFDIYRYDDYGAGGLGTAVLIETVDLDTIDPATTYEFLDEIAIIEDPPGSRGHPLVDGGLPGPDCTTAAAGRDVVNVFCQDPGALGYYVQYRDVPNGTETEQVFTGPGTYTGDNPSDPSYPSSLTVPCCVGFHHIEEFGSGCNLLKDGGLTGVIENCNYKAIQISFGDPLRSSITFNGYKYPDYGTLFGSQIYDEDPDSVCSVDAWTLYRKTLNGTLEEIASGNTVPTPDIFYGHIDRFFDSSSNDDCQAIIPLPETDPIIVDKLDIDCGVPFSAPDATNNPVRYFVKWEATARTVLDSSCPDTDVETIFSDPEDYEIFPQYGIFDNGGTELYSTGLLCCPALTDLTASIGDCFSEQQGEVTINWNFVLGEDETPVNVVIDRNASASIPTQSTTLPPEYSQLSGGWIDTGVLLPVDCSGPETVIYDVTLNYTDAAGNALSTTQSVEVEVPCCADDCEDIENPCELCWGEECANLSVYLESYFENPLTTPKQASFQIKYCINDACANGIDSAEVYITLPVGIEVIDFTSNAVGVSFEESFLGGVYPGRWKFIVPSSAAANLLPSFGVLGTVVIDKPLGDAVACIDEENTIVSVDYPLVITRGDGGGLGAGERDCSEPLTFSGVVDWTPELNLSYSGATVDGPCCAWQTGPCLSTCTDEVDMGFGDFHYSMDAVDNSIFDVKYCLTQGSIDSFVLVCLTGDFKTTVTAIDTEFGDVALRGWNVNFRNLAPGFTVIYGRGSRPIPTSGLSTLMRVYLSDNILQRNPAGEESCMCVFPVFMNLGSLFPLVSNYIVNLNTQTNINLKDSEKVSGTTEASFTADEPTTSGAITTSATRTTSAFVSDAVVRESAISANFTPPESEGYQIGSGFIADLEAIGEQLDERFKPLLDCLKVSYGRAITGYQNDEEYARETRENAIRTVHYFRIFFTIWTALLRSIPNLAAKFQNSVQTVDTSCTNAIGVIFDCEEIEGDSYIRCNITYDASLCPISGVGFDIKEFQEFIDDSGNNVTYSDVYSWVGDASDKNYFQAYSTSTGRYLSAYGANLAQRRDSDTQIEYLRTDKSTDVSIVPQYLTTIYLKVENFINWGVSKFNFENSICTTVFDSKDDEVAWDLLDDPLLPNYASFVSLRKAIKIGLNKATVVTNEKGTTPNAAWTGNSFAPSGTQVVDVKDFLTTMVNVIEPDTFDLSEENLEALVKLPSGTTATTLKEFYDLNDIDLSGVTYSPSGTNPYTDPTGNYILPTIDANADGRVDIVDFVALRNTWLYSGKYPLSDAVTISAKQIVPTECCLKIDTDAEILVPDQCSQFCIQPPCYGKVWISDMLLVKDKFDRPNKYILEISYAVNCSDERVGEVDYPVQDVSGVQFRVEGLNGVGIVSSINGFGTEQGVTATACKAKAWSDYILSSDNTTKDTVIAFSTNGKYIDKGKGALCYLFVDPESIPDSASYLANRFEEEFITTNEFIKFDDSPEIQEIANVAGSKVGYPLANLRYNSYHTDELLIYERFGIRVTDYKLSTNRYYKDDIEVPEYINLTSEPAASWTGDRAGDGVDDADLEYVLRLAATSRFNTYELEYDADANGVIDILDVQAVAHTINNEVFEYGTNVVPRYCCSLGELPEPKISILDYDDGDKTIPVIQNGKIREITISGSSLGCGSNPENQGGILLYWDTVKYADYYVVYRKGKKDTFAIPIIAAGPGNRNRVGTFPGVDRTADRKPISILPNMWIDYPPQKENDCSTLANFDVEAYFEGSVADSVTNEIKTRLDITELTPGAVSESFTYWVVAISREGEIKSNEESGLTSLCNFSPISSNISLNTVRDTTVASNFDAYHPLASRPIGAAEQVLDEPLPVWFFTQNSISGKGRESITQKGGVVTTDSKLPDRNDASGVNQRKFTYQPKPNFVGKDSFKYVTTIVDIRNRFKPSTWCKSIGTVTVFVTPPPPTLSARAGENNLPDEKDKAFLLWYQSKGATSYRLYRDSVLIDTIDAEFEKLDSYTYTDSAPTLPSCPGGNPVENIYEISSVYLDEDGTEIESVKNSASVVFVCPPDLDTSAVSITLTAIGFNIPIGGTRLSQGTVNVSWTTVTNAQGYIIYRRESTLPGPWIVIGTTTDTTFSDKISSCNDCSPAAQSYDYYISATARGFESDPSPSQNISIPCYDAFVPQVSDKTATIQERGTLSSFVTARAVQGTISTYTLITSPASDEGTLTFNPDGTFTFVAALNFTGTTQFEWQAEDSCGNTSNALFTINVEAVSTNTNLEYVIGDANEVTSQQNATQVRIRNRKTSQVPFMLNNKGASSLRKRCFAFAVTRGIEPFSWAPGTDGCSTPNRFPPLDPTIDPDDLCTDPTIGSAIIGSSKIGGCE